MVVLDEVPAIYEGYFLFFERMERSELIAKGKGDPSHHALGGPQPQHGFYHT